MIAQTLAEFANIDTMPDTAMDVLRLSLLDWCAVAVAGKDEPVARILRNQALGDGGRADATLIGHTTRVPVRAAALVNGTTSHALDYDDTHFAHIGHPSVAVIPAALAVAEMTGSTGTALQQAALIGAEASIRVGLWLGRAHYQAGFHQTATAGTFGATLAAGRLLSLTTGQMVMALGLASTLASGLKSQFGTMGKPMNAGIAAANGVEAALLVKRGFVSATDGLHAVQGFGPTHHGEGNESALDDLGQTWLFEDISHKFHACCHGLHAMLEALAPLIGTNPDQIAEIAIATHPRWLSVCDIHAPETGLEAKFSYRMTAAMRILGVDTAHPGVFTGTFRADPVLISLRDKVTVSPDNNLSEMQVQITVDLGDGTRQTLTHDLNAPAPIDARSARVRAKAAALLGPDSAGKIWALIEASVPPGDIAAALQT